MKSFYKLSALILALTIATAASADTKVFWKKYKTAEGCSFYKLADIPIPSNQAELADVAKIDSMTKVDWSGKCSPKGLLEGRGVMRFFFKSVHETSETGTYKDGLQDGPFFIRAINNEFPAFKTPPFIKGCSEGDTCPSPPR